MIFPGIDNKNILVIDTITWRHRLKFFLGRPLAFEVTRKNNDGKRKRYAVVIGRKK